MHCPWAPSPPSRFLRREQAWGSSFPLVPTPHSRPLGSLTEGCTEPLGSGHLSPGGHLEEPSQPSACHGAPSPAKLSSGSLFGVHTPFHLQVSGLSFSPPAPSPFHTCEDSCLPKRAPRSPSLGVWEALMPRLSSLKTPQLSNPYKDFAKSCSRLPASGSDGFFLRTAVVFLFAPSCGTRGYLRTCLRHRTGLRVPQGETGCHLSPRLSRHLAQCVTHGKYSIHTCRTTE